jgi:hypothetical protein
LRRTLERDRYGLVARVLMVRDHCTETDCAVFALLSDVSLIKSNMHDRLYDTTINRYASAWIAAGPASPVATAAVAATKPSTIDFPSSASIPPVNIMSSEPGASSGQSATAPKPPTGANAQALSARPAAKKPAVVNAAVPKPRPVIPPAPKPQPAAADSDQ